MSQNTVVGRNELEAQMRKLEAEAAALRTQIESLPVAKEPVDYKQLINWSTVDINGCRFDMSSELVTQEQFNAVCELPQVTVKLTPKVIKPGEEQMPVVEINYYEALEVAARLSVATGEAIGLPSDAEWVLVGQEQEKEMAQKNLGTMDVAWVWENAKGKLQKVGTKWRNRFGVADLFGNAWEWIHNPQVKLEDAPTSMR